MPKQSYGPLTKERSRLLLFSLLDFANDSLDTDERQLDLLRSHLQTHWQSSTRLVVRTKLRYLQALSKLASAGEGLSLPHIKAALKHLAEFVGILEDNRTVKRGSDQWHFTLRWWRDRWEREANLAHFDRAWEANRPDRVQESSNPEQETETASKIGDRWQQLCREALDTRLTSNPMTAGDGMAFELGEVYVPLGVAERKSRSQEEEDCEARVYEPAELLDRLKASEEPVRAAIVGEPGAGKTTLLQQLAIALLQTPDAMPIWISLADLEGQSLETYLTQTWLRQALRVFQVPTETVEQFAAQFQQGRVWLLLDAVDELGGEGSGAIAWLARELKGWLSEAHVALTCRLNIWDAGKNTLATCQTFRCISFSDGTGSGSNQVQEFIRRWFKDDEARGEKLCRRLEQRSLRRIRELVRHPLYLALLCCTWASAKGKLPATKASLYRQFAIAHYEWKQDLFPTTLVQRRELNKALSELALAAMKQSPPSFRLLRSFIDRQFPDRPELLTLALQLGWLNKVGCSDVHAEPIYSFYHPTFQEYFAARAISTWQEFFALETAAGTVAPIFMPIWHETILLWVGRDDIAAEDKTEFTDRLVSFNDCCGGLYSYRTKFLAARGLTEMSEYPGADALVKHLIRWRFAKPDRVPQLPGPIVEQAGIALSRTDRSLSIPALESFLQTANQPLEKWLAAHSLGKNYDPGNPIAISTLTQLLQQEHPPLFRLNFIRSLEAVDPGNPLVQVGLIDILKTESKPSILRKAANRLAKVDPDNPLARNTLKVLLSQTDDPRVRSNILTNLQQLDHPQSPTISNGNAPTKSAKRQKNEPDRDKLIANLLTKLDSSNDLAHRIRVAGKLGQCCPDHPQVTTILLDVLSTSRSKAMLKSAVDQLRDVMEGDRLLDLIPAVRDIYLSNPAKSERSRQSYRLLWYWSATIPLPDFQRQWQLPVTKFRNPVRPPEISKTSPP
ncbi:MAG: NACHT domain-containing NTPase [Synechococcus sp.]